MKSPYRRSGQYRYVRQTSILGLLGVLGLGLVLGGAGCSRPPAGQTQSNEPALAADLYVDWDDLDWHLDRYLQISLRDFAGAQNLVSGRPADDYRAATTYQAHWDSVGLHFFLRLHEEERQERRRLAAGHHADARRLLLGVINHYRSMLAGGYLPNLNVTDFAARPQGVETAVTNAIGRWISATGLDPSNAAAWRDLAYFCGVVGDRPRQQRSLGAALAALDRIDPRQVAEGNAGRLRRDILLDLAWLALDQRQPGLTLAYLEHVEPWLATPSPERDDRRFEAQVLRGLALVDRGRTRDAADQIRRLPSAELRLRAVRAGVREDLRWQVAPPHGGQLGYQRANWPRQTSYFARDWIRARIGAPSGEIEDTLWLLGPPPTALELPPRLAWRYWQDRGQLHAQAGDRYHATRCFERAAYFRPYLAFFPLRGSTGPSRLGPADVLHPFFTGYDRFFLCGDLDAYQQGLQTAVAARP